jgi:hypothetical protein
MPEMIVIFFVVIVLAGSAAVVIGLVWYFSRKSQTSQNLQSPKDVQVRLAEIDGLRSRNLISQAEYEEKRRRILEEI